MTFQYIPYIWFLMGSALTSLSLALYSLIKQRNTKCVDSFIMSMFVVTIWSFCNALEMTSIDFSTKLFWANMQYIAYCFSPVTLLAFCMQFTGYDQLIRNKKFLWFAVIPTIILVLIWTDNWHGLIRYDFKMDYSGEFPVISKKYGALFFVHAAYSHSLNTFAWILLIRAVYYKNTVYRKQAFAMLFGVSLIIFPNIAYVLGLSPFKKFDITPVFFGPAGLIIYWAIFRYKLFNLVPIARATVIESMDAGVIILDLQDRVLDINPAFKKIVEFTDSQKPVKTINDVCGKIPELVRAYDDGTITQSEFCINKNGISRSYEVLFSPINNDSGTLVGRLAIIRDITEKKEIQLAQLYQQRTLAAIKERERLARDIHDNLGQVLGFINLQAQAIKQELLNSGVEIGTIGLDKLVSVTQSAHQEIREHIKNVRSLTSAESNFVPMLLQNIMVFEEQTGLKVEMDIPNDFSGEELENSERITVLNIFKEALNNIKKHADANHVKISVSCSNNDLHASVEDDGKGFDITEIDSASITRFGLSIMRERASEIGGHINIQSISGKGTCIDLYVPIKEGIKVNENKINAGR